MTRLEHPFEPVYDAKAEVLILGSYPSVGSVEGGGYYGARSKNGKPRNDFWPLMADVFNTPWLARLLRLDPIASAWDVRYMCLKTHLVALWDVVASCERDGPSSDGELRDVRANDIPGLAARLPDLRMIAFTGTTAKKLYFRHVKVPDDRAPLVPTYLTLPSPSRANTTPYAEKLRWYRDAILGALA